MKRDMPKWKGKNLLGLVWLVVVFYMSSFQSISNCNWLKAKWFRAYLMDNKDTFALRFFCNFLFRHQKLNIKVNVLESKTTTFQCASHIWFTFKRNRSISLFYVYYSIIILFHNFTSTQFVNCFIIWKTLN